MCVVGNRQAVSYTHLDVYKRQVYAVVAAPFYTQSVKADCGITVKSSDAVEKSTLQAAADILDVMLSARSDVVEKMI